MTGAVLIAPMTACKPEAKTATAEAPSPAVEGLFTLPALSFAFDALAPNIDARTMEIHHDKHHAGYVRKLNNALEGSRLEGQSLDDIMSGLANSDEDTGVRNNGGGHYNHSLFWSIMAPDAGGAPSGDLSDAINAAFGGFDQFKDVFAKAAKTRFGSGWAWLSQDSDGKLYVSSTPNQDNPMMTNIVTDSGHPLLGIDVWEHAYYLNYQNRRGDYINNFFNVINWDAVSARLG